MSLVHYKCLQSIYIKHGQCFWNLNRVLKFTCQFWTSPRVFRVPLEISQVYWRYKAMNLSLHYSIKCCISRMTIISHVFWIFFQLMNLLQKDFQRNLQDSIQMADTTKRNSNGHFILGNTGHVWRRLTVYSSVLKFVCCDWLEYFDFGFMTPNWKLLYRMA